MDSVRSDVDVLGFGLDDERWLKRIRDALSPVRSATGTVGSYEILGMAGRGGQGVVYRARQPHTGRTVAIKRLNAGAFATPDMRARLIREIEAASALNHNNIVSIHGCEMLDEGPIAVFEWIDGQPMDEWFAAQRGADRVRRVIDIVATIADAVQHAHQRGVIHRDLKPDNILVDEDGHPHVVDFGVAKFHGASPAAEVLTSTGIFVGTLAYAAPEHALGSSRDLDVRADVYSLGAVLFQGLTETPPFLPPASLGELIEKLSQREALAPSRLDPELDPELDAIVMKATANDKELRYPSMAEFASDLRRHLRGEAVLAHPPTARYRLAKFVSRNRIAVLVGAAFAAVLVAATVTSTYLRFESAQERERAETALAAEKARAYQLELAEAATRREQIRQGAGNELLQQILAQVSTGQRGPDRPMTLRAALDEAATNARSRSAEHEDEGEAWLNHYIGEAYLKLREHSAAKPHFERALELRRHLFEGDNLDVAESLDRLGRLERSLGHHERAVEHLTESLDIRRRLLSNEDGYLATGTNSLGVALRNAGRSEAAEALLVESIQRYQRKPDLAQVNVFVVVSNLALVYSDMGKLGDAIELFEHALARQEALLGAESADLSLPRTEFASLLMAAGQGERALEQLRQARDVALRTHGDTHLTYLRARAQIALGHSRTQPEETVRELRAIVEIHRSRRDRRSVAQSLAQLATHFESEGHPELAEMELREAICEASTHWEFHELSSLQMRLRLAELLRKAGRHAESQTLRDALRAPIANSGSIPLQSRLDELEQ